MNKELLLEKYFERSLSEEEQQEFDRLIITDKDFAEAFTFEKNVKKAIALNESEELKQKLKSFEKEKTVKLFTPKWFYAAACVLVIAGGSLWFILQPSSQQKIFETYYQTYPNVVAPSVRGAQTEDIKSKAFYAYDNREYELAADLFAEIYRTEHSDYALFYRALSLMERKEYKSAEKTFKQFNFNEENVFTPYIKWYLALAELQTDQKAEAISRLKELSGTENPMQETAKKLLTELD